MSMYKHHTTRHKTREVRVGPLSCDQAEKLAEDLEYDAVS